MSIDYRGPAVQLIASTQFHGVTLDDGSEFTVGDTPDGGSAVAEAAGRACYQSWHRPNPKTASNAGYIAHILDVAHGSVLEHGSATFYMTGVSRALTHELIRHRHLSFSQLSQRFVDESDAAMVMPPLLERAAGEQVDGEVDPLEVFADTAAVMSDAYEQLTVHLGEYLRVAGGVVGGTAVRKAAREAARAILPNATETRIVVTGNYRAWREVLLLRGTVHADAEIRRVAVLLLRELQVLAPNVFGDLCVTSGGVIELGAGRVVAA